MQCIFCITSKRRRKWAAPKTNGRKSHLDDSDIWSAFLWHTCTCSFIEYKSLIFVYIVLWTWKCTLLKAYMCISIGSFPCMYWRLQLSLSCRHQFFTLLGSRAVWCEQARSSCVLHIQTVKLYWSWCWVRKTCCIIAVSSVKQRNSAALSRMWDS